MNVRPLFEKDASTAEKASGHAAQGAILWQHLKDKLPRLDTDFAALSPEEGDQLKADGFLAGRRDAHQEIHKLQEQQARSIDALKSAYQRVCERAEQDLVALSLLIAREVLAREVELSRDFVQAMVKHAFQLMSGAEGTMTVRVSAKDHAWLKENASKLFETENLSLVADARLIGGGVIAETGRGRVDASFASRLRSIAESLDSGEVLAEAQAQEEQS